MSEPAPSPPSAPEQWATDGVVVWRVPGGPTVCAMIDHNTNPSERAYHARLVCAAPQLLRALDACATRLERCVLHNGTDPEYAALAVSEYRDLLREVGHG